MPISIPTPLLPKVSVPMPRLMSRFAPPVVVALDLGPLMTEEEAEEEVEVSFWIFCKVVNCEDRRALSSR